LRSATAPAGAALPVLPEFSLVAGGPLYRLAWGAGLVRDERDLPRLGLALALVAWLPLLVLAGARIGEAVRRVLARFPPK
jgi:hypothetical protein